MSKLDWNKGVVRWTRDKNGNMQSKYIRYEQVDTSMNGTMIFAFIVGFLVVGVMHCTESVSKEPTHRNYTEQDRTEIQRILEEEQMVIQQARQARQDGRFDDERALIRKHRELEQMEQNVGRL
jgi:hypothetical protein